MSYGRFETARAFHIEPSRYLAGWLSGVHLLAGVLAVLWLPFWPAMVALAILLCLALASFRSHFGASSIRRVVRGAPGEWHVRVASGEWRRATLEGNSVVFRALMILNFRDNHGWRGCAVLPRDSMEPAAHRRLRVILGTAGHTAPEEDEL